MAVDIPDAGILDRLVAAGRDLLGTGNDLRPVSAENLHITVRFLGDSSPGMVRSVEAAMEELHVAPFVVELRGLGFFEDSKYITVIWAGIKEGAAELATLFNMLEPKLERAGFRREPRGFSPHLTIARVKAVRDRAALLDYIARKADYTFGTFTAQSLKLKKSVLTPQGPIYTTLKEKSFS
ncbi:MAG: RNA 2',3'-cyclic phosphodiesterase [Candidatus Bathyarchaeia archaeon]